jgi:hypothetical protein
MILGASSLGSAMAHWMVVGSLGGGQARLLLGPLVDSARVAANMHRDEFNPYGPDSAPGSWVSNLFPSHVVVWWSLSLSDEDAAAFRSKLDGMWAAACTDPTCIVISADASVPMEVNLQVVACALVFGQGVQVGHIVMAARKHTPDRVECFSLQIGISAVLLHGCSWLVVLSDSTSAVETLLDLVSHLGQVFSLDACRAIHPWFTEDVACPLLLGVGSPQESP